MSTPATTTLNDVMAAIATQVRDALDPVLPGIQVEPELVANPTPPCIDIYPGDPFLEQTTFGPGGGAEVIFTVRTRVGAGDQEGGQQLLLDLLDPYGTISLWTALETDATFGGLVDNSVVESVSGFHPYESAGGAAATFNGSLLGSEWRLRVVLS